MQPGTELQAIREAVTIRHHQHSGISSYNILASQRQRHNSTWHPKRQQGASG
jgi:hypothetical protein